MSNSILFKPFRLHDLTLPNRIVMSPTTRLRADENCVPTERMARYYSQRASAGLIITEGTHPSPMGRGYTTLTQAGFSDTNQRKGSPFTIVTAIPNNPA